MTSDKEETKFFRDREDRFADHPFGSAAIHHQWFFSKVRSKIPDSPDSRLRINRHEHQVAVAYVLSGQFSVDISGQNCKFED